MRAVREHIQTDNEQEAFVAYKLSVPAFVFKWHYHPEYELTLILNAAGKRIVGDSYENFQPGDLVLLGPHLPHTWASERNNSSNKHEAIVVQFPAELFEGFMHTQPFKKIKQMLDNSSHGVYFRPNATVEKLIMTLPSKKAVERVAVLLQVLDKLSHSKMFRLASVQYQPPKGKANEKRINTVFEFVQKNFRTQIGIHDAAAAIHLSPGAFCKFFKRVTATTFSDYVNAIRVAHACTQLIETDKPISTIAYECGFENLTYFNRVFLKKKKMQPGKFRVMNS